MDWLSQAGFDGGFDLRFRPRGGESSVMARARKYPEELQRLLAKPWMRSVSRSSAVMVGVVWIGIAILAFVAVNM
ncbi:MAG TPA: hypothetical protein VK778_04470 [Solirubrobacteraceae bacterium]|jgi:hypothetical protein|nr:hypothetical protein [Solirubrobacteraceae bacterium]